jgi:hypothetical protein
VCRSRRIRLRNPILVERQIEPIAPLAWRIVFNLLSLAADTPNRRPGRTCRPVAPEAVRKSRQSPPAAAL